MLCPACGHDRSSVIKTREDERTGAVKRVRECRGCGHVWRTREEPVEAAPPPGRGCGEARR